MDEHKYKIGDLYKRNHFKCRKINDEWCYWRDGDDYAEEMLSNLKRKTTEINQDGDMAACNP